VIVINESRCWRAAAAAAEQGKNITGGGFEDVSSLPGQADLHFRLGLAVHLRRRLADRVPKAEGRRMVLPTECIASLRQLSAQVSAAGAMLDGSDIMRELSQAVFCWHTWSRRTCAPWSDYLIRHGLH